MKSIAAGQAATAAVAGALVLVCSTTSAGAAGSKMKAACISAQKTGKEHQQAGHLREARDLLASCAKLACGSAINRDCTKSVAHLDAAIALVGPVVTDEAGQPVVDAQVKVDGASWAPRLDGRSLPLDPGLHEFSVIGVQGVVSTQKMMIVEGQRGPLPLSFHSPGHASSAEASLAGNAHDAPNPHPATEESAPATTEAPLVKPLSPPPRRTGSVLPYLVGSVGALGVGAGALLTYWGRTDNDALAQCSPHCLPSNVQHVQTMYIAADAAFGVGVVGLGVATYLLVREGSRPSAEPPPRSAYVFDIQPMRSGAAASVSGSF